MARTLRGAYQSKYINSVTNITTLQYGPLFFFFFVVSLDSLCVFCCYLFPLSHSGVTTLRPPPCHLRACLPACVLAFSLDSLANWELVPTGCTLS
jgi:hypothetical protein